MGTINGSFPLFFNAPSTNEMKEHMKKFDARTLQEIEAKVRQSAVSEGVQIQGWDKEWAKYHLYDSTARLVKALVEKKKEELFSYLKSKTTADLIASHCPLLFESLFSPKMDPELVLRGRCINSLELVRSQWNAKFPRLRLCVGDEFDARSRAWKAKEISFLVYPGRMPGQTFFQFSSHFLPVVEQLIEEGDEKSAEIALDLLLRRESFHPMPQDFSEHLRLKEMEKIFPSTFLHTASESLWKAVSVIPSSTDRQAKFKPLSKHDGIREAYAYQCDRIFGFGMTAPTKYISASIICPFLFEINEQFKQADIEARNGHDQAADIHRKRGFDLLNHPTFPAVARNAIFGVMYRLYGRNQDVEVLGEKLFYNYGGFSTTDAEKSIAIEVYLDSEDFLGHMRDFRQEGSLQLWKNDSPRVYDVIVKNQNGGALLKSAPKILAHLYALLGMIKGSKDCSSGNTLVVVDESTNRVVNFWDFDDERSMSASKNFWDLRIWQLGLPQCARPFDRSTLLLFTDQNLVEKLKALQTSQHISREAYQEQNNRLNRIIELFRLELGKDQITLTPRELFFYLFGGREDFMRIKQDFNNNKTFGQEGIRISPIELFEFHLPEQGRGAWYTSNENEKLLVGRNMRALYSPELP
jgi:hypothetical protein